MRFRSSRSASPTRRVLLQLRQVGEGVVLVRASNDTVADEYGTTITVEALMRDWLPAFWQHRTISLQHNLPELRGIRGKPFVGRARRVDFAPQLEVEIEVLDPETRRLLEEGRITGASLELVPLEARTLTRLGSLPVLGAPLRFPAVALGPDNTLELRATGPVALLRRAIYQTPCFVPPPPADFTLERSYSTNETGRFGVVEVSLRLEDPYPAGFEPTSSLPYPSALGPGRSYYASTSLLNDRAVFLFEKLPAGEYVVGYKLRALFSGTYFAAPPRLLLVNEPEVYALGSSGQLTVR